jgi:hypothetical protein
LISNLFCEHNDMDDIKERAIESVGGEVVWNMLPKESQDNFIDLAKKKEEVMKEKEEVKKREEEIAKEKEEIEKEKGEINKNRKEIDFFRTEMFRVDRATLSIEEMDPTRSEVLIEQSREYKEKGQEVMEQIMAKKMTGVEGRQILDDKVKELKRLMDARRHKTKSVARKKIEKNYEKLMKKGWDKRDFDMDTVRYDERELIVGDEYSVYIPSLEVFVSHAMTMQENILSNKEIARPEHYCMASICLSGKRHFYTKTSNTPVLTPDGKVNFNFYPTLIEKVKKNLDKVDDYEESSPDITCKQITMSYTISQWENIRNWYPDNTPTMPIKKFLDFSVFLASNEEVNCEQQCVEELNRMFYSKRSCEAEGETGGGRAGHLREQIIDISSGDVRGAPCWDPTKKFEEMIPQEKILSYIPCQGDIRYVNQFSDLMTSYHENIANTDCRNIARIIKWNDHMAVITELRPIRRRTRVQYRKPLRTSNKKAQVDIFVDIEAFNRETDNNYAEQVPYLVCWADSDEIRSVSGEGCMADFVDEILSKYANTGEITLYAWYGSGYDYQHIYPFLKAKCTYDECKLRNNAIIYAKFIFEPINLRIHLKDPYLFILTSLDKAAKAFGVINKGKFPHEIIKDWADLDKVLENWVITRNELIEERDNNRLNVYVKEWEEFESEPNYETILQKATDYCTVDVLAMQQVWSKFTKLVDENLGMEISTTIFTLSQLSMKLMEASLPPKIWIYVPGRREYDFMHKAIYGGRVVAKNGDYREQILYADVVSLYPSAMKLLEHGYGKPEKVKKINWNKHGIYEVTLTHKSDNEPKNYMPFVPRRIFSGGGTATSLSHQGGVDSETTSSATSASADARAFCIQNAEQKKRGVKGKLYWGWFKQHRGTYHTYDLLIAKDIGYNIECHEGLEYPSKGYIFNEFIDKLYSLKDEHSNCNCPEKPCPIRMIVKIALNGGGYGKFVQKPIDIDTYIVRRDVIAGECEKLEENEDGEIFFGGTLTKRPTFQHLDGEKYDKMIFENESKPYYATQAGISILSGSRYRLYNLCKQFPGMDVIYSDTDSIFVRKSTVDWELFKQKCGTELGQLDDTIDDIQHGVIHRMLIGGPKMYAYEYCNNDGITNTKLHCKGIPAKMLTLDQFEHLLEDEDRHLAYKFAIMRKRIVGVQNMNIVKLINKT